jgi:hypothetical protein
VADEQQYSRQLLLAIDAWQYGTRDDRQQQDLQRSLDEAVRISARRSGLDPARWQRQDAGDGLLSLITEENAEPKVAGPFVRELDEWLRRHNHDLQPHARLRLRVAVHHGVAIPAELGYAGTAPVHVCRIRDARAVRGVLEAFPGANLVLAVSEPIFEDLIRQRHSSLSADDFVRADIDEPAKQFSATAWLHVPGLACDDLRTHLGRPAVSLRFAGSAEPPTGFFDQVVKKAFEAVGMPLPQGLPEPGEELSPRVPAGMTGTVLAGTWIEHVRKALAARFPQARTAVGIALDSDPAAARSEAVELAGSPAATRLLSAAPQGRLVIVVSDRAYRTVVGRGGRLVFPESYRQPDGGTGCWIRVPGHSVPPEAGPPAELPETDQAAAGAAGSITQYGDHSAAFTGGTYTAPIVVGTVHNHDGRHR